MSDHKKDGLKNEIAGKAKQVKGVLTDDDGKKIEGKAQESAGKAEQKLGEATKKKD